MGTWSAEILGNDTAFDVHQSALELYDAGTPAEKVGKAIQAKFSETLAIRQDSGNVWLALALALWELGALDAVLRARVVKLVTSGRDLQVWRELKAAPGLLAARERELAKLVKRIQVAKKKPRPRRRAAPELPSMFKAGACLVFRFPDRTFGGVLVTRSRLGKNEGAVALMTIDIKQRERPTLPELLKARLRQFAWETPYGSAQRLAAPNGKVARLHQYGVGYDKPDQRENFLAAATELFELVGQLEPFQCVLYATGGLGVKPAAAATPSALRRSIAKELSRVYRYGSSPRSPTLRTLSRVLTRS